MFRDEIIAKQAHINTLKILKKMYPAKFKKLKEEIERTSKAETNEICMSEALTDSVSDSSVVTKSSKSICLSSLIYNRVIKSARKIFPKTTSSTKN